MSMKPYPNIPWMPDDQYAKARFQFKAHTREALSVFKVYGMDVYVEGAVDEIFRLAEDFSLRTRGVDKPLNIDYVRRKK